MSLGERRATSEKEKAEESETDVGSQVSGSECVSGLGGITGGLWRLGWSNGILAQEICLEAPPDVGSEVSGLGHDSELKR